MHLAFAENDLSGMTSPQPVKPSLISPFPNVNTMPARLTHVFDAHETVDLIVNNKPHPWGQTYYHMGESYSLPSRKISMLKPIQPDIGPSPKIFHEQREYMLS